MTNIFTVDRFDDADGVPLGAEFVDRIDAAFALPAPEWTPENYLKTTAFVARPGIYIYNERKDDGSVVRVREYVPLETLLDVEWMDSLKGKAITLNHPQQCSIRGPPRTTRSGASVRAPTSPPTAGRRTTSS